MTIQCTCCSFHDCEQYTKNKLHSRDMLSKVSYNFYYLIIVSRYSIPLVYALVSIQLAYQKNGRNVQHFLVTRGKTIEVCKNVVIARWVKCPTKCTIVNHNFKLQLRQRYHSPQCSSQFWRTTGVLLINTIQFWNWLTLVGAEVRFRSVSKRHGDR